MGALTSALLLIAQTAPGPANAGPDERRAAYGPLRVCLGEYALRVRAGEGVVSRAGADGRAQSVSLLQHPWSGLALVIGPPPPLERDRAYRTDRIKLASGLVATRYRVGKWEGYRAGIPGEAVFASERAYRFYVLPGSAPVVVAADAFGWADRDRNLLDRIERRGGGPCDALAPVAPGTAPSVELFRPEVTRGPARVCAAGMAIALREGETLQRGWNGPLSGLRIWQINGPSGALTLGGGVQRQPGIVAGSLRELGFRFEATGPATGSFLPPRDGGWRWSRPILYVTHAGASAAALDALKDRVTLVGRDERRCFES